MKYVMISVVLCFLCIGCGSDSAETPPSPNYDTSSLDSLCNNSFDVSETEDPATFTAYGEYAVMRGLIGSSTPERVADLLADHPEVETIVITFSPGSEDDEANLEAALLIHNAKIDTCVPPGGEINSGGVDFFLAGEERWLAPNSWVGVHAWAGDSYTASDIPKDDPEHDSYLEFYRAIDIDEAFYWYTLEAAEASGIHNMSSAERTQFQVETP